MYYEEAVINGVLSHRSNPTDPWVPFTPEALTVAYVAMKRQAHDAEARCERMETLLHEMQRLVRDMSKAAKNSAIPEGSCAKESV
jgi:hypothetical protein